MDLKQQRQITKFVDKKEESIRLSSIHRDATLFTAARLGTWKQASQQDFIDELAFWTEYFATNIYKSHEMLEKENYEQKRKVEIKDPLNHIDVDVPQ